MRSSDLIPISVVILLVVPALSCGGEAGGGLTGGPPVVSFTGSGTPSSPDLVRLTGASDGRQVEVAVALAGPTTSDDIYAFAFDVVIGDPSVLEFVPGSAVLGPVLATAGCLGTSVLASQSQDRVVVGVTKLGGCPGNGVPGSEKAIVRMTFRMLAAGTSTLGLAGSSRSARAPAGAPAAYDSTSTRIDSIRFDVAAGTVRAL